MKSCQPWEHDGCCCWTNTSSSGAAFAESPLTTTRSPTKTYGRAGVTYSSTTEVWETKKTLVGAALDWATHVIWAISYPHDGVGERMPECMVVCALSLDVRPIACLCKKSYDKVITRAILSHPRTTLACSRAPAAYWRKTIRKILCVCFVQRSLSDASDRACSVCPYFYLRLLLRMHSDQTEFCVTYDFLIASSRAPIVKAP